MLGRRQGLASLLARWLRSSARAARCSARAAPCGRASSGCVPSPPFPPSSSPRACSTRAQSARGSPETDVRTWAPRRALTRASLPRACRGADAVASASARSPRAPRSREASSRPPRVSRRMGKQSGRASFSCRLFSDEERRRRRRAFSLLRQTPGFSSTPDTRLTRD